MTCIAHVHVFFLCFYIMYSQFPSCERRSRVTSPTTGPVWFLSCLRRWQEVVMRQPEIVRQILCPPLEGQWESWRDHWSMSRYITTHSLTATCSSKRNMLCRLNNRIPATFKIFLTCHLIILTLQHCPWPGTTHKYFQHFDFQLTSDQ